MHNADKLLHSIFQTKFAVAVCLVVFAEERSVVVSYVPPARSIPHPSIELEVCPCIRNFEIGLA